MSLARSFIPALIEGWMDGRDYERDELRPIAF